MDDGESKRDFDSLFLCPKREIVAKDHAWMHRRMDNIFRIAARAYAVVQQST